MCDEVVGHHLESLLFLYMHACFSHMLGFILQDDLLFCFCRSLFNFCFEEL